LPLGYVGDGHHRATSGILDEVLRKINGQRHWLWCAVDQHGVVLDILVQTRPNQQAAERFLWQAVHDASASNRAS
jgi:putative transposase